MPLITQSNLKRIVFYSSAVLLFLQVISTLLNLKPHARLAREYLQKVSDRSFDAIFRNREHTVYQRYEIGSHTYPRLTRFIEYHYGDAIINVGNGLPVDAAVLKNLGILNINLSDYSAPTLLRQPKPAEVIWSFIYNPFSLLGIVVDKETLLRYPRQIILLKSSGDVSRVYLVEQYRNLYFVPEDFKYAEFMVD